MRSPMMVVTAAALVALPAAAQTNDIAQPPKPKKERKLCRQEQASGSNLVRSVCRTRAEWAQIDGRDAPPNTTDGGAAGLTSGVTR